LKRRESYKGAQATSDDNVVKDLSGIVEFGSPSVDLSQFEGSLQMTHTDGHPKHPLSIENFLPRGSILKNTAKAYGVAIYTGKVSFP